MTGAIDDLEIAREMIRAGVPMFLAVPHGRGADGCAYPYCSEGIDSKAEFHHPAGWQHTVCDESVIDRWTPGDALCAVMGHGVDVIDVDPRNGGQESYAALLEAGLMPRVYGEARTPSGGRHLYVAGLHAAKGKAGAGVDVQAGADDGTGRGFVYIAPTARTPWPHTDPDAVAVSYTWATVPDVSDTEGDDSGAELGALLRAEKAAPVVRAVAEADDPFVMPDTSMTYEQARAAYLPMYERFRNMTDDDHLFNDALNKTAMVIGHYVPAFIEYEQAVTALFEAATFNGSVAAQGSQAVLRTLRSGLMAGMREPKTRRDADRGDTDDADASGSGPDAADLLIGEMLSAETMRNVANPKPLIQGVLDLDTISWLIGKSGCFKSFVALDWAGHVGNGKPWQGRAVAQGTVVYIVAEGARGMKLRVAAWERLNGPMANVWFLPRPVQASNATAWDTLVEACRRLGARFVIIDTQARVTVGMEENSAKDMGVFVDQVEAIKRATGACVLPVHHIGRTGTDARGSSALDGAQDAEIRVEREGKERRVTLVMDKQKDQDDSEEIELELAVSEGEPDPETGRNLSSLVVVAPGTLPPVPVVRDWIDNLTGNQAIIAGCMVDFVPHLGGTKAEVKALVKTRSEMARQSFDRAWDSLIAGAFILRIKGTQHYVLASSRTDDEDHA